MRNPIAQNKLFMVQGYLGPACIHQPEASKYRSRISIKLVSAQERQWHIDFSRSIKKLQHSRFTKDILTALKQIKENQEVLVHLVLCCGKKNKLFIQYHLKHPSVKLAHQHMVPLIEQSIGDKR